MTAAFSSLLYLLFAQVLLFLLTNFVSAVSLTESQSQGWLPSAFWLALSWSASKRPWVHSRGCLVLSGPKRSIHLLRAKCLTCRIPGFLGLWRRLFRTAVVATDVLAAFGFDKSRCSHTRWTLWRLSLGSVGARIHPLLVCSQSVNDLTNQYEVDQPFCAS